MTEDGKAFIQSTQLPPFTESDQTRGLPQPPLALGAEGTQDLIDLPAPAEIDLPPYDLRRAIEGRRSLRDYGDTPLSLDELSYLLWCTQGVKEVTTRPATLRTVPSAGARHVFETYVLVNRVEGLRPGLYRFLALEHKLVSENLSPDIAKALCSACLEQDQVLASAVTFVWAAVVYRMTWRYPGRGYRYLLLDAGHVCQNLYLAAESIDCGVCAIGAFLDEALNNLLGLDGEEQFAIYVATLGKKP